MVEVTGVLKPELAEPLLRAVLRIEMELLGHDVAQGDPDVRTTAIKGGRMRSSFLPGALRLRLRSRRTSRGGCLVSVKRETGAKQLETGALRC